MVPLGLRILLTRSQIVWQCDRLATTSLRRVNKIASVPPYLLRSAFGHDGLWVFANRILSNWILADRSLANRRRRRRRLLARQIGGGGSAQHDQQSNSAQHGDEPGRAQYSKHSSRHQ